MRFAMLWIAACAALVSAPGAGEGAPAAEPLPPDAPVHACARLDPALLPRAGDPEPVDVAVDLDGPVTLPASFVETARTALAVQGAVPGTELCAIAALDGVRRVRPPFTARPK